ncbi:hypothetical protein MPH_01235 [Macrophomina phaseolina MS6]|uniref:Uncharacterized protein n=1 Tax=Macrophomina phaseolina (strain MS6) TaxID=1126212 RepID=K2S979_MACPH|nr:hypothetical protein MPH_01235 [Macrophomina phaseolina MS6]
MFFRSPRYSLCSYEHLSAVLSCSRRHVCIAAEGHPVLLILRDFHNYRAIDISFWDSTLVGRHLNNVSLACYSTILVVIEGPLLHHPSSVISESRIENDTLLVFMSPNRLAHGFSGNMFLRRHETADHHKGLRQKRKKSFGTCIPFRYCRVEQQLLLGCQCDEDIPVQCLRLAPKLFLQCSGDNAWQPSYHSSSLFGWRDLDQGFPIRPLVIVKAFRSPVLENFGSNENIEGLVKYPCKEQFHYGELSTGQDFENPMSRRSEEDEGDGSDTMKMEGNAVQRKRILDIGELESRQMLVTGTK